MNYAKKMQLCKNAKINVSKIKIKTFDFKEIEDDVCNSECHILVNCIVNKVNC